MQIGSRECDESDMEEDRRWIYRNCGRERVSVCGVRIEAGVVAPLWEQLSLLFKLSESLG